MYNWNFKIGYDEFLEITLDAVPGTDIKFYETHYDDTTCLMTGSALLSEEYISKNRLEYLIDLLSDVEHNKALVKWALKDYGKLRYLFETLLAGKWTHTSGGKYEGTGRDVAYFVVNLANDSNWQEFLVDSPREVQVHPVVERYLNEMNWFTDRRTRKI